MALRLRCSASAENLINSFQISTPLLKIKAICIFPFILIESMCMSAPLYVCAFLYLVVYVCLRTILCTSVYTFTPLYIMCVFVYVVHIHFSVCLSMCIFGPIYVVISIKCMCAPITISIEKNTCRLYKQKFNHVKPEDIMYKLDFLNLFYYICGRRCDSVRVFCP